MAFPLKLLVPCLCSILFLSLIVCFSQATAKPCKCSGSDRNLDTRTDFYLIDKESGPVQAVGFKTLFRLSDSEQKNIQVWSIIPQEILLWQYQPSGLVVDEASFSAVIVYQPLRNQSQNGLAFLLIPYLTLDSFDEHGVKDALAIQDDGLLNIQGDARNATVSGGSSVSVTIGAIESNSSLRGVPDTMAIDIKVDSGSALNYSLWIDYDHVERRLSVFVDAMGNPKPDNTIAEVKFNISDDALAEAQSYGRSPEFQYYYFGLLSTVAQQLSVHYWNVTVEDLPDYPEKGSLSGKVIILSSVLGSVAATTVMAIAVACYFNSRYRRWHKDLDQLARSMERLPGVPTKVEFADIKKATGNFHETMKLGGGGFGTVYRCTLPATASKTERPIDVAVKRFTRDVQNQRYDDFLAEVSIINRLRHKNIVPLVGWSYNKGEPLLVFEFMTNGSLDQHLFPKGGSGNRNKRERPTGAAIQQWATRYGIVRGIATGLHYVHHEYEPMVLHRDIKASNMMLDSSFGARLGDFGIACTVAVDRNSATGVGGTWGYIAPEYAMSGKATRQTDIYALGVLILEVVTGERALINGAVDDDDVHITDRVWRLYRQQRLPECLDAAVLASSSEDGEEGQLDTASDVERLLLLGLACSSPNPSERPTMPEVVQVIAKSAPPPTVPLMKPIFVWPPEGVALSGDNSIGTPMSTTSTREPRSHASLGKPTTVSERRAGAGHGASFQLEQSVYVTATSELV
uniref:Uncharacterized protein n=1 Tax=Avena sativa TaxID=4498 RepID=A0ACD6A2L1_AVESA